MAHEERVFVRRNRKGEIVRIVKILTPARPGRPAPVAGEAAPAAARKPLLEEVSADKETELMRELAEQSEKK